MPDTEVPGDPPSSNPARSPWFSWLRWSIRSGWWLVLAATFAWGIVGAYRTTYRTQLVAGAPMAKGLATLSVRVTSEGPFQSAHVEVLSEHAPGRYVSAAKGPTVDGTLTLSELPSGPAWLIVRAPGAARVAQRLTLYGHVEVETKLAAERVLVISVEDEQGEPVAGATVLVKQRSASGAPTPTSDAASALPEQGAEGPSVADDQLPFGQATDEHGVARISGLGPGPFEVSAFARGFSAVRRDNVTQDTKLVLAQLGALVVSVIGPTGDPVPNAEVQLVGTRVWPAKRAESDEHGRVILGGLPEGLYDLRALKGRLVSPILANLRLERGERRQVEARLVEGRMIQIDVTTSDEAPEPIPNAKLVLAEHGLSAFPLAAVANEDGKTHMGPIPPGPAFLSVRAEGFIARGAVPVPDTGNMLVKLLRGGAVYGEIEDVDGRPIRDARIEIVGLDLDGLPIAESPLSAAYREAHFEFSLQPLAWVPAGELGVTFGPVPFVNMVTDGSVSGPDFSALPSDYSPWISDGEGHFRASPVPPGRVRLIVRHNAFAEGQSRIFTMGPGGNVHVKVVLDVGHTLRGRVVDDGDRPVAAARILVSGVQNGFERGLSSARDGTFEVRGVPSEVSVSLARPEDTTRFVKREKLRLDKVDAREIEFVLPAEREALSWTVFDDQNAALELAQVSVQSLDPDVPLRTTRFTDAQGRVTIDDASGLNLRIAVEAPGFIPTSVEVKNANDDVKLILTRGVKLKGRITAVRGRTEVGGARVSLEVGSRRDTTTTSALGEYEFANVSPGKVRLRVNHEEYAVAVREVNVEATGYTDRPFELPDIDLLDAVTVSGRIVDKSGRPVPTARVAATPLSEVRPRGALDEEVVLSDDAGAFVLHGVAPGSVTLFAQSALAGKGQLQLDVPESGAEGIVIALDSPLKEDGSEFNPSVGSVALGLSARAGEIVVTSVPAGGEAERSGLSVGDVIRSIDGTVPKGVGQARGLLSGPLASDVVVAVERGSEEHTYRIRREQTSR
jgi:protocatechuate 3,4-dioxygenase beta subunit